MLVFVKRVGVRLEEWIDAPQSNVKHTVRFITLLITGSFMLAGVVVGIGSGLVWVGKNHPIWLWVLLIPVVVSFLVYLFKSDSDHG